MKNRRDSFHTICALALALMLCLGTPARAAGLFGWLLGEPEATEVPAMAGISGSHLTRTSCSATMICP